MKRRAFLKAAGFVCAGSAIAAPAIAQGNVRWRMTTSWPKSLDTIYGSAAALCDRVSQLTEGRFQIQPFAGGEIVGGLQAFDATASGAVECCHTYSSYYFGKDPAYGFDGGMPFGLNSRQQQSWMLYGDGLKLMRELFRKANLISFPVGNVGVQMGGWFRKEINSVDDLKGVKFRIGGLGGAFISKLGVVPQQLAAGDIYPALERGTIDAAEFIGPYDDEKLGFVKVAKYYYTPSWWEGSAQITSLVNAAAWESLPTTFKNAFEAAANEQTMLMMAKYDAVNPAALKRLIAAGTQLRVYPRPVLEACYQATLDTFSEFSHKSADFRRIHESWVKFRDELNQWFRVAEFTMDSFRLLKTSN
jgi:TRAP-type mannitol/chloroaromatic compound transport system substrate-binding protein